MTRILTDGAESGDTSRIIPAGVSAIASTINKRTGNYSYRYIGDISNPSSITDMWSVAASEYYVRLGITVANTGFVVFQVRNGGSIAARIRINTTGPGATFLFDDGTTNRGTTSPVAAFNLNEWHVFEVHIKHAASPNGIFEIKFDGSLIASFTGAMNSQPQADRIFMLAPSINAPAAFLDDMAVNDTNGSVDNSWIGDGGVLAALVPTATGTYTGFLASGSASTWQSTDEIPANSTDFAYTSVSGTVTTFAMSDISGLPAGASISRIWLELYAKETAAAGDKIAAFLRSGSVNSTGTSQALTTAFARYESAEYLTDPGVTGSWTTTAVNNIEAGMVSE